MGRPQKTNADYFSHDNDMRNDRRILALRNRYSFDGYGVWCMLLEVLTDAEYFALDWDDLNQELIAAEFRIDQEKLTEIVAYCCKLQLVRVDDGKLLCDKLIDRFDGLVARRKHNAEKQQIARGAGGEVSVDTQPEQTPPSLDCGGNNSDSLGVVAATIDSRVDKSRVDKNVVDKNINTKPLSLPPRAALECSERERIDFLEVFFFKRFKTPYDEVSRFVDNYEGVGWLDKNGRKITKRIAVARSWKQDKETVGMPLDASFTTWLRPIYERLKLLHPNDAWSLLTIIKYERVGIEVCKDGVTRPVMNLLAPGSLKENFRVIFDTLVEILHPLDFTPKIKFHQYK